jgi:hypothetical protein
MMKQSAQKSRNLSLVPAEVWSAAPRPEKQETALKESFDGWLNTVVPALREANTSEDQSNKPGPSRKSLTLLDITQVNRATIREGTSHRAWPPDVVLSFLAADVIKRKK